MPPYGTVAGFPRFWGKPLGVPSGAASRRAVQMFKRLCTQPVFSKTGTQNGVSATGGRPVLNTYGRYLQLADTSRVSFPMRAPQEDKDQARGGYSKTQPLQKEKERRPEQYDSGQKSFPIFLHLVTPLATSFELKSSVNVLFLLPLSHPCNTTK